MSGKPLHDGAIEFWDRDLDPQNLGREADSESDAELEREIRFAMTPEVAASRDDLLGAPAQAGLARPRVVDLGAGLGSITIAFARAGFDVIAVDTSPQRLAKLMKRAARAGVAERVETVVAAAERLPFEDGSVPALFTRSVLIHTDLPKACGEIRRVLAPGGRASLVEPRPGNPFAWVYRRTLAPKEWAGITRYFDEATIAEAREALGEGEAGVRVTAEPFFFFSFLAFVFQFAWPSPQALFGTLKLTNPLDAALFKLFPFLRSLAWFVRIRVERSNPCASQLQ